MIGIQPAPSAEKDAAYWQSRCWSDGCEREPAPEQSQRWRGRYCADCERALEIDAERIAREWETA